ncbi:MAG: motility protein A, partial [Oscillospiraceae bacterium]|nr:motility protein A [Oscillospiraceae bacterium]
TLAIALTIMGIILTKIPADEGGGYKILVISLSSFWDLPSLAIVVGGTFATLMLSFPLSQFTRIPKHLRIIFMPQEFVAEEYITKLVECAKKARINGLLALEDDANAISDNFLKNSLQMIVDSIDPEKVKAQMESWAESIEGRHEQERSFYDKGAQLAPAFGMIGTLIGLINMLKNLEDVSTVGPNMAVALVTTFYGSVLANIVFSPISNKLRVRHDEEYLCMQIVYEGVQAIQSGENPKLINEKLIHLLPEYRQQALMSTEGGAAPAKGKAGKSKDKKE